MRLWCRPTTRTARTRQTPCGCSTGPQPATTGPLRNSWAVTGRPSVTRDRDEIQARVDPSDVVQEAQAALARRLSDFLARRPMPFHLWARKTAYERLLNARRDQRPHAGMSPGRPTRTARRWCA